MVQGARGHHRGQHGQGRGLRDDQQPDRADRPPGTSPRFASGRYDIGAGCTGAVGRHLIIAGG
jgi:hypothetical protein